ncbi:MAG: flavodoxin domain-containing protein [Myxococcales bacterium]|nr:flavodoxin domain-containing protein [Myxococcales bacterium]
MRPIHVLYGTETFNSEDLAQRTGEALSSKGLPVAVLDMSDFEHEQLVGLHTLLIVTSTFGAGEPPSNAIDFHEFLMGGDAPRLPQLRFSVCALGDTAYEDFCECGKQFDRRLAELGGQRIAPRIDCDTDFEEPYERWVTSVLAALDRIDWGEVAAESAAGASLEASNDGDDAGDYEEMASVPAVALSAAPAPVPAPAAPPRKKDRVGTRKNPFFATVVENYNLNSIDSAKETRHVALSLADSGVEYKIGDALGVFPRNCPDLVRRILQAVNISRDTPVEYEGEWFTVRDVLIYKRDVMQIDRKMMALARFGENAAYFEPIIEDSKAQSKYIADHHLIDFVTQAGIHPDPAEFIGATRPLAPRLYSISSSPAAHPGEVHLTVDVLRYEMYGLQRKGVASTFLGERAGPGVEVAVYVQPTSEFILCEDDRPIIMIGPGTGIAPFRAFLEEREARNAPGQSWLFFGAQREAHDFLYREQLEGYLRTGRLARLDTAFSRDQEEKIYVQTRMWEAAPAIWKWLEADAVIYICGDASRMAKDVHQTLLRIIGEFGRLTPDVAEDYLKRLHKEKRYLKDVY